ncbi:MAG TPA: hypothetical protein VMV19_15400 [Xanthobacteraceae bacterium]|nr:hypothetical protein [Xanthobacteraceae bacterium]
MSDTSGGTQPPQPGALTGRQLLGAVKDNFLVVSGVAFLLGVGFATIFLAAYLSAFDWHLLWFIEYTDIVTFGLIALGIVSGSIVFLQAAAQTIINLFKLDTRGKRRWTIGLSPLLVAVVGFNIWSSVHQGEGYFHILFGALVIALGVTVVLQIVGYMNTCTLPNVIQSTFMLILFVTTAACGGQWLGYSVLESAKLMDIKLKDGTLNSVKLIIVMSRHTILLKGREIYVLPTTDISQFHSTVPPWVVP